MTQRYIVQEGSNSCHCCFEYTVVDTTQPTGYEPKPFGTVAECFDQADANRICMALNFVHDCEQAAKKAGGKTSFVFEIVPEGVTKQ